MGDWRTLSSRTVHENPYFSVRENTVIRPNGKEGMYYTLASKPAVYIIPVDADGNIVHVKLLRYPTHMESWELPAGAIEAGEDPLEAAKRELHEETGYTASQWEHIGRMQVSNSVSDCMGEVFICRNLQPGNQNEQTDEGIIETSAFSPQKIFQMVASGEITDSLTLAPLMLAYAAEKLTTKP